MHGNIPQKVGRLVANLALHPRYLSRYVAHNVFNGRSTLDLEIPWFSYAAVDFLDKYLQPDMAVGEYGSGGSTFFFARRARSVYSIEDNVYWFELVKQRLAVNRISNVAIEIFPFDFKNPVGFENSAYLHAMPDRRCDAIVVDGTEEWTPVRPACFRFAEERIKAGGIIVLDDSWRYPDLRRKNRARHREAFESVGPCRPGVTSTDVFFY
jgi:hypothetical protein